MQQFIYLFDCDGVILDTESQYSKFWAHIGTLYYPQMQSFAEDCSQMLKDEGDEFYESYDTIKAKMNSVLTDFGYLPLNVYEDAYSEEEQLKALLQFKDEYLASK